MNDTNPAGTLARFLTLADTAEVLNVSARQAYGLSLWNQSDYGSLPELLGDRTDHSSTSKT